MLVAISLMVPIMQYARNVEAATIIVDDDGGQDYTSIQDAINNSNPTDIILVYAGTYHEDISLTLREGLSVIGNGSSTTIINGTGTGDVVTISSNGCTLSGFEVKNSGSYDAGIQVESNNNEISDCEVYDTRDGILVKASSTGNTIERNECYDNWDGIRIEGTLNNVNNNTCSDNTQAGIVLGDYSGSNVFDYNVCDYNSFGIYVLLDSASNTITNNLCEYNSYGIYFHMCDNNTISNNEFSNNTFRGIQLYGAVDNDFTYNLIRDNVNLGIRIDNRTASPAIESAGNTLHHNNIIDNQYDPAYQGYDEGNNTYDDGSTGNYWNNYDQNQGNGSGEYWLKPEPNYPNKDVKRATSPFNAGIGGDGVNPP